MKKRNDSGREGGLDAPTRHPIDWRDPAYYDHESLFTELYRVFDLCHGCRRCLGLCRAFPIMFDLIDDSETLEMDGVDRNDYWKVVDHCYLCDMCFIATCPYVPPHEWDIDFPMLMLRAKAERYKRKGASLRDNMLSQPERLGRAHANAFLAPLVNWANRTGFVRSLLESFLGISKRAPIPEFQTAPLRARLKKRGLKTIEPVPAGGTSGKVALFSTCYGNYNHPTLGDDLVAVFEHNGIPVTLPVKERCCGMPRLEMGDIASVDAAIEENAPELARLVDEGWDIVIPMPSCAFMIKHLWRLIRPEDETVKKIAAAAYDPFEYLMARHAEGKLNTDFKKGRGAVAYHAACHARAQNMGLKTRDLLSLLPETKVDVIQRCSGHDGTYAVKKEFRDASEKILKPLARKINESGAGVFASDCPMAAANIATAGGIEAESQHPLTLLRDAYGI